MTRSVTILTSGTRGDVQPYLALGAGLQRAGVHVRIATHAPFAPLIHASGLLFTHVDGNPNDLFVQHPAALTFDGDPIRSLHASWRYLQAARPAFDRMLLSAWHACQGSDALLVTLPTIWGASIAERLGVPCVQAFVQPLTSTAAFPSALLPVRRSIGSGYNRLTHTVIAVALRIPWHAAINRWRRRTLGLKPLRLIDAAQQINRVPSIYGFSERVVARPADWPQTHQISGYWFDDHDELWQPPVDLLHFLRSDPPPIAIGFGSMAQGRMHRLLPIIRAALDQIGRRAVLIGGFGDRHGAMFGAHEYAIDAVPHAWLFGQVAAVVHHGGAGTTAASLRAGVPTTIVPFGVDQFFWGERVATLGVGPQPLPSRSLTAERLARAIDQAVHDRQMRQRADRLGQQIRAENGVARAVALVQKLI